jgi:hypothetical protein
MLFPRLTELEISSVDGINFSLPFHLLPSLREVYVSDLDGKWTASQESFMPSLMAALVSNAMELRNLKLKPTLPKQAALLLPEMPALTTLDLTLCIPVKMDDLAFLNRLPHLTTLFLSAKGSRNMAIYPEARKHLAVSHPQQAHSKITTLDLRGDPFFIF